MLSLFVVVYNGMSKPTDRLQTTAANRRGGLSDACEPRALRNRSLWIRVLDVDVVPRAAGRRWVSSALACLTTRLSGS